MTLTTNEDTNATDETVTVTHIAISTDADYDGIAISDLTVNVIDNDTPRVTGVWTQPGDRQLVVNWTATDKADGYKVQWKAPGDNYNTNARMATVTGDSTTTHTIPNLTNGTEYKGLVTATWTGHSDGQASEEATGTPNNTLTGKRRRVCQMTIEWEEDDNVWEGSSGTGATYTVWYGQAFLNPDVPAMKWIAYGWPEPDSDNLPLFNSQEEAMALCEAWEIVKIHSEQLARALFQGTRSGEG